MSSKNFFVRSIRGWLPEEPKMPKSKLRRTLQPIALMAVATTIVSLFFSPFFVSTQTAAMVPPLLVVQATPNSSYVELTGVADENCSFILVLTDGNHRYSENLTLTFSLTEKGGGKCIAGLAVECDSFSNDTSVDGSIVDGNLVIDSRKSLFLINPDLSEGTVVLTEADDWQLAANVRARGNPSTAVEPYGVTAVMASSHGSLTEEGWPMSLLLGYDPDSGLLVYSGYSLSDVLLKKLGIELLLGGSLELVSYSDDLNLEFSNRDLFWAQLNTKFFLFYSGLFLLVASAVVTVVLFLIRKIKKRRQLNALSIPDLPDTFTKNCDKRGW